jgi:hypothetical protein
MLTYAERMLTYACVCDVCPDATGGAATGPTARARSNGWQYDIACWQSSASSDDACAPHQSAGVHVKNKKNKHEKKETG